MFRYVTKTLCAGTLAAVACIPVAGQCPDPIYSWQGEPYGSQFGPSVSGAGDVNGDGFNDVIIGESSSDVNGIINTGSASVLSGSDGALIYFWHGQFGDFMGKSVSGAGDVDGDGFDDLIVGAHMTDGNGADSGSASVFSGATGDIIYTWHGDDEGDQFGESVSGAGDVNGDGYDDVIVGAHFDEPNNWHSGSAYVFSGATGELLHTWHGQSIDDRFGEEVSGAGDIDGDGFDDLIVGTPHTQSSGNYTGSAYVFSGATGNLLYTWDGDSEGDRFGFSVSDAGDVNMDGFADVIVGADRDSVNGDWSGSAYVFSGSTGDILYTWHGDSESDQFGESVSGSGDLNGDDVDDLVVGTRKDDANGDFSGSVYVFSGADGSLLYTWHGSADDVPGLGTSVSDGGDINGDGFNDVIAGSGGIVGSAHVFTMSCGTPCPTDIVGDDGLVGTADLLQLLAAWGACDGCPEDINSDGAVNTGDLLQLLADWGPCR